MLILKEKIAFNLDNFTTKWGLIINVSILGLIVLSLMVFIAETYTLSPHINLYLHRIDTIILIFFSGEYLIRFWCAENKLKYVISVFSFIDLIAIVPLFIGAFDVRFIRIFRGFRILKLIRFLDLEIFIFRLKTEDSKIFARILFTLFTLIFINSSIIYEIEHRFNPNGFKNFFDALYFSVVTMTTVGFGDIIPLSEIGKAVTLLMIFSGVLLIPWQLGELIKQLVKTANKTTNQIDKTCSNCSLSLHDSDANFCKNCGFKLPRNNE